MLKFSGMQAQHNSAVGLFQNWQNGNTACSNPINGSLFIVFKIECCFWLSGKAQPNISDMLNSFYEINLVVVSIYNGSLSCVNLTVKRLKPAFWLHRMIRRSNLLHQLLCWSCLRILLDSAVKSCKLSAKPRLFFSDRLLVDKIYWQDAWWLTRRSGRVGRQSREAAIFAADLPKS